MSSHFSHIVDLGRCIDCAHLHKAEVPVMKILHFVGVEGFMLATVFCAPLVS